MVMQRQWPALPEPTPESLARWAQEITRLLKQGDIASGAAIAALAYQPLDADLTAIAALTPTDGNIIVGDGSAWVAESGATARTSLGLGAADDVVFRDITGDEITSVYQDGSFNGGRLMLLQGANSTLSGDYVRIDTDDNVVRFVEEGGSFRGAFLDLTQCAASAGTSLGGIVTAVAQGAVSAATTLDLDISSGADMYELELIDFRPVSDGVNFHLQVSNSGTFLAGASDYKWNVQKNGVAATDAADNQIRLVDDVGNASPAESVGLTLKLYRPSNTTERKNVHFYGHKANTSSAFENFIGAGQVIANTSAVDGLRVSFSSGNIASGYYALRAYSFT